MSRFFSLWTTVGKTTLHLIRLNSRLRRLVIKGIRFCLRSFDLPVRYRDFLMWPMTSHLLPSGYIEDVRMVDGTIIRVGLDDILNRLLLHYSSVIEFCWEPQTTRLMLELIQGDDVVLIGGAHIGYHALQAARKLSSSGGHVHAFEPVCSTFAKLEASKNLNGLPNLHLQRCALGEISGQTVRLYLSNIRSSIIPYQGSENLAVEAVASVAIDDYILHQDISRVALVFLDVEGTELEVLQGARKLLADNDGPDIMFEVSPLILSKIKRSEHDIYNYLWQFGYELFFIKDDYRSTLKGFDDSLPVELVPITMGQTSELDDGKYFNVYATKQADKLKGNVQAR